MYEEIMRNSSNSFFALLNIIFPENSGAEDNNFRERSGADGKKTSLQGTGENEWMQEYRIIYNSYVLEGSESSLQEE